MQLLKSIKEDALKSANEREQNAHTILADVSAKLDERLSNLNVPRTSPSEDDPKPCASLRTAVTACYKENGIESALACTSQVEAFTECAKQLCSM